MLRILLVVVLPLTIALARHSSFQRFAFGPVAAVRPWLLLKGTLLLLALDVWHTHLGAAWRYGAAGFNVAHFAWMNGLPLPTREAYVAMLVGVGVASIVCAAMARPPRTLVVLITFLYTWGWSCSMHDSYQHHYLISLLLFGFCFFPQLDGTQLFGEVGAPAPASKKKAALPPVLAALPHGPVPRVHAFGYTLVTSVAAIVYTFTAISKSEPEWLDGDALRNITQDGARIRLFADLAHDLGMSDETMFWTMGHGMVVVQIVIAIGYLFATLRDGASTQAERTELVQQLATLHAHRDRIALGLVVIPLANVGALYLLGDELPRWLVLVAALVGMGVALPPAFFRFAFAPLGRPSAHAIVATVALLAALSFHVGAEYIELQIGWFSYYMILLAIVALAPGHWLSAAAMSISAPFRGGGGSFFARVPVLGMALGIGTAVVAIALGQRADLPGAYGCAVLVALASFAAGISTLMRPDPTGERIRGIVAAAVAMMIFYASVATGSERYDYYRFAGGDFRRRHEYQQALDAYRAADRYAPEGQNRRAQIEQMEQLIESGAP